MGSLLPLALTLHDAGLCVLRAAEDGTKATDVGQWKPYQTERPSREQLESWFSNGATGIGVLCGHISGDLEMLEFEGRAITEGCLNAWRTNLANDELFSRIATGYVEQSPSGGVHLFYRVQGEVEGNVKLAERLATDDELTQDEWSILKTSKRRARRTLVETRGQGGWVVIAPSFGTVHPSGLPWRVIAGDLTNIPTVTEDERTALHVAARELDSIPKPAPMPEPKSRELAPGEYTPGEEFNERGNWHEILEPHGWLAVRRHGNKTYWRRPGKRIGISAVSGGDSGDYLYVWSTSTDLPDSESMSKWRVHAMLNHGGDYSRAAGDLRRAGYGSALSAPVVDWGGLLPAAPSLPAERPVEASSAAVSEPLSSWQPQDIGPALDGSAVTAQPTVGRRSDNVGLFYPGRVHSIASESEGGKTWLALFASAWEIGHGNHVVYLDFEDDANGVVRRLLTMGVPDYMVKECFHYIRPEQPIQAGQNAIALATAMHETRPTLVVMDGITEAMSLHNLEIKDNTDVAKFGKLLPSLLTKWGSAVVLLDHVIKDKDGSGRYALGGAHKLNGLNGAAYILRKVKSFGEGVTGSSKVLLAKDRPAQLRKHAVRENDGMEWFGDLIIESKKVDDRARCIVTLKAAEAKAGPFRPTQIMSLIQEQLIEAGRPLGENEIYARLGPNVSKTAAVSALSFLQDDQYILKVTEGPRTVYKYNKPFMRIV